MAGGPSNAALQAQLTALGETMQQGFSDLKESIKGFDIRLRAVETHEAGCQPALHARIVAVEADQKVTRAEIEALRDTVRALKDVVIELRQANRLMSWIGGIVGSALIVWVVGQLLGLIK
jgi:hypothetical protein